MVRAGVWCCACALLGLRVARAPCPGVLLRRRGDTPSLWRARLAPWWAPLAPGCGPVRGSGVCVRWEGGGLVPLPSPSPPCPSVPLCRPALPAYPLRTRWVGLGWTVRLGGLTWCFFPAGRRGLGSLWGRVAPVVCRAVSCVVLGLLAPVHQRACPVCGGACAVSWAAWLLFTGVHALCVVLCVRCPGPPGSCSPVCTLCVWWCVYGVLGLLAPVHRCARSARGVVCTVSWASWLLFTGVHALCMVLCVRCPGPPGSCSPVCTPCAWCCVYGVLGLLGPVHRCARSVCGVACTASWASWLLFIGVHALCVVLRVRSPGPPGSCSPVCTLCVCGVACTVSWASWLLFTGVHAVCVVLRVRCPGPPGSCSPVCTLCVWCYVYGVLGLLAPVHQCARSVCGGACTVSWASWLLFTGVHALCVVLCVRCPGPPSSCSPVCTLCAWCCVLVLQTQELARATSGSGARQVRFWGAQMPHSSCLFAPHEGPPGAIVRGWFPLWHVQKPPPTVRPAGGPKQSSHLRGARRHARAAPGDKEPWPLLAPQPHAASRSTASRVPRGYGQRPLRSQRPQRPTDIICHRSPTPFQEAPHQTRAHPHHSHACRARATGSASPGPPPGSRRNIQLVRRLPPRVGGQPTAGGTARRGHTAKGTRGRPTACTRGGGTTPPTPSPASGAR